MPPPWLQRVRRSHLSRKLAQLPCIFFRRRKISGLASARRNCGVLAAAECVGSNGVVAIMGAQMQLVLLMKSNLGSEGMWHVDTLLRTACTTEEQFAQLVRNAQKANPPEPLWHEWATLEDQFGEIHEFKGDTPLPGDVELMATSPEQRMIVGLVNPPETFTLQRPAILIGPSARAKQACMFEPTIVRDTEETLLVWPNIPQMCVVYEDEAEVAKLYSAHLEREAEFGAKRQRTNEDGAASQRVVVTLQAHFVAVRSALFRMWKKLRIDALEAFKEKEDYLRHGYHILKRNRKGAIVWGLKRDWRADPLGIAEAFLCKVFSAKRDQLSLAQKRGKSGTLEESDLTRCIGLAEGEDYHKYANRKLIKKTEADLRFHKTEPNGAAADDMIAMVIAWYDSNGWVERSKAIAAPVKAYTSPLCSKCPFGYETPDQCFKGGLPDKTKAYRVADVIRHNMAARLRIDDGGTSGIDSDDDLLAAMDIPID